MNEWLGRLGAALTIAVLGGFFVWLLMALLMLLANYLPVWIMWVLAAVIFAVTVIVDWFVDASSRRRRRHPYESARRSAMARDDDEL